jgi:hypothetical protein
MSKARNLGNLLDTGGDVVSGSLDNIPTEVIKQATDPTISTNPSGGVGTVILNNVSGEIFCCTNATIGSNIWINIGGGSGDVENWKFGGTISGYTSGGNVASANIIDKFSFTSDGNATDVGDLTAGGDTPSNHSSSTYGYNGGRYNGSNWLNVIDKFSFTSDGNATDVGDLTVGKNQLGGTNSETTAYVLGGRSSSTGFLNTIEKFSFSSDGNATDMSDLLTTTRGIGGHASSTHGYGSGGAIGNDIGTNAIFKFSFATEGNATDVGDLTIAREGSASSSSTHGYLAAAGGGTNNVIDKFSFSSDGNATDVGDLINSVAGTPTGQSSTTYGYTSGGWDYGISNYTNTIQKYSFSSDSNATDVGDLTTSRTQSGGQQV